MKPLLLMITILCLPLQAVASHTRAGIDLCEVHKDTLPPGLSAESLPDHQSPGAELLQRYCTQCHNLPGPDRHTAAEWLEVASNMFLLMDVSHRFGGLMGKVEVMQRPHQDTLLSYLERHAMPSTDREKTADMGRSNPARLARLGVLVPFLLLMGLGLLRWWSACRSDRKPCAID